MRRPIILNRANAKDVHAIAKAEGFAHPAALRALEGVAGLRGGLRNVENVIRVSQMFAGGDVPDLSHLKAAITDMKLTPKGGK